MIRKTTLVLQGGFLCVFVYLDRRNKEKRLVRFSECEEEKGNERGRLVPFSKYEEEKGNERGRLVPFSKYESQVRSIV